MEQAKQYEYVDLGLPSGLKWAKCNIGAETETDYGDYFMWGSTRPNTADECTWEHAPFNDGNTSYNADAINSARDAVCPNGVLAKEYDAAVQIMGSDWRMPTKDDFQELIDYTNNEWISNYNGTGVNGRKFTSKTNGNSIFIPASGYRLGSSFRGQGRGGDVWSSSVNTALPGGALELGFGSVSIYMGDSGRYYGLVVRGVMD